MAKPGPGVKKKGSAPAAPRKAEAAPVAILIPAATPATVVDSPVPVGPAATNQTEPPATAQPAASAPEPAVRAKIAQSATGQAEFVPSAKRGFFSAFRLDRRRPAGDCLRTDLNYEWASMMNREWHRFFHGLRMRGQHRIPACGPVIFAPNHTSYYDPPVVAVSIPYRLRFMAWDALFNVPLLRMILNSYGAYPVKLQSADRGSVERTLQILRSGQAVVIFPEGERHEGPNLGPFEAGVARMALQTGATVVPVTVTGADVAFPPMVALPRLFKPITVKFHPAVKVTAPADRAALKQAVPAVNAAIAAPIARRVKAWERLKSRRYPPASVWSEPYRWE